MSSGGGRGGRHSPWGRPASEAQGHHDEQREPDHEDAHVDAEQQARLLVHELAGGARVGPLGGLGEVDVGGRNAPAFAIRYGGKACAYLNRCAHVAMELDWQPGMFFDFDAEYLLCSTHGAFYDPITGACRGGACTGHGGLRALTVVEQDGRVLWQPDGYAEPLRPTI